MQGGDESSLTNESVINVTGSNATGMLADSESVLENILQDVITVNQGSDIAMSSSGLGDVTSNTTSIILNGDDSHGQQSTINAIRLAQKRVRLANRILGETLENASE